MKTDVLDCRVSARRRALFGNPDWNGLDFLEVLDGQRGLCVHFFGRVPEGITVRHIRIDGGRRIRDVRAIAVHIDRSHDPELDDCLRITLNHPGDFSTYRLCLIDPDSGSAYEECRPCRGIDRRFSCLDFTFKVECPSDLDCKPSHACAPTVAPAPDIDYLAKDYTAFRQLMLDRLALIMPEWQERHVPDLGITLVELLAYAGDYQSYYQDAVGTEAYLDTARLRISLRRHARLVDYHVHEGSNARAWVTVATATDLTLQSSGIYFITGYADIAPASGRVVRQVDLELVPRGLYEVFEPEAGETPAELKLLAAHSRIHFYTWGDFECCLLKGATRATLVDEAVDASQGKDPCAPATVPGELPADDPYPTEPKPVDTSYSGKTPPTPSTPPTPAYTEPPRVLHLKPGDVLIFEEVLGPGTGNPADADPTRRHAVRLTTVTPTTDPLLGNRPLVEIEWAPEDALPFSLCLSARLPAPDCRRIDCVSIARGNVILVDHGRTEYEPIGPVGRVETPGECRCDCSILDRTSAPARFYPTLSAAPLTFVEPLPPHLPASRALIQDPRLALPQVTLAEYVTQALGPEWHVIGDLLASDGDARRFVAEIDDEQRAHLRFGDGEMGRQPGSGTRFRATYRVGNGTAGNVGRETINYLVVRDGTLSADAILPTNPLAARGGTAPESAAEVKLLAPSTFRVRLERAIAAEDYAAIAARHPRVQRAAASLRWTGSWYEARVAVDPLHVATPEQQWLDEIAGYLHRFRRIGHDLAVTPARDVPLDLAIEVCVDPHVDPGHVRADLLDVFGTRARLNGALGIFHPDALSFGDGVYLSRLVAAALSVDGVTTARVTRLQRLGGPASDALDTSVLPFGPLEIPLLDNDPDFPENGRLELIVRGGR
jgi:hypothetical protein